MQIKASAPGSMMLLGEYAVLHGNPALVCAIDKRITVTLTPRSDTTIQIRSALLGEMTTDLSDFVIEKPFQFVLGALHHFRVQMRRGCDIQIDSEFSDQVGLGSSAAVTVATLAALVTWLNIRVSALDMVRHGRNVIKHVQGTGSGADVAASVQGGIVAYASNPVRAEKFSVTHPITVWYAGYKTPTVEAIRQVNERFAAYPSLYRQLCQGIGQCAIEGIHLLRQQDWQGLGAIWNIQQGLMESLGVSPPLLQSMVKALRDQSGMHGAKISGSGMGDCVIGLGDGLADMAVVGEGVQRIPVAMTLQGVVSEKI